MVFSNIVYCFCTVFLQDGNKFWLFGWEIAAAGSHQLEGDWLYIDTLCFSDGSCFGLFCDGFCESKAGGRWLNNGFFETLRLYLLVVMQETGITERRQSNRNSHNCLKTSPFHYASTAVMQCIFITAPSLLVGLHHFSLLQWALLEAKCLIQINVENSKHVGTVAWTCVGMFLHLCSVLQWLFIC